MARSGWEPIPDSISSAGTAGNCARLPHGRRLTRRCWRQRWLPVGGDAGWRLLPAARRSEVVRLAQQGGKPLRADINAIAEAPTAASGSAAARGSFASPRESTNCSRRLRRGSRPRQPQRHRPALRPAADLWVGHRGHRSASHAPLGWPARVLRAHQRTPWHRQRPLWRQLCWKMARSHLDADVRL
jgi:hypothetical protein